MGKRILILCATAIFSIAAYPAAGDSTKVSFPTVHKLSGEEARSVKGLLFKPEGEGPFPAVVLLHTCGGMKYHVSRWWPEFFVKLGSL